MILEKENCEMKLKVENLLMSVTSSIEKAGITTSDTLLQTMTSKQVSYENQTNKLLESL